MANPEQVAQEAVAFHERQEVVAVGFWREGLNLLLRGFDDFHRSPNDGAERMVMLALLMAAWNSLNCAFDIALRGYQLQALNLLRMPVEYWMTYWYLRNFPEEHSRFLVPSETHPSYNDMLQKIEAKYRKEPGKTERAWLKQLHSFSHVDPKNVGIVIKPRTEHVDFLLGPTQDGVLFRYCAIEACKSLAAHMEALENLRMMSSISALPGRGDFVRRCQVWMEKSIAEDEETDNSAVS